MLGLKKFGESGSSKLNSLPKIYFRDPEPVNFKHLMSKKVLLNTETELAKKNKNKGTHIYGTN